jgi:hypothetical protein
MEEKEDKFVLIIDGKRVSGLLSEDEAEKKASKLQSTLESTQSKTPKVDVKQHLLD